MIKITDFNNRNPDKVKEAFDLSNDKITAKKDCWVVAPKRYESINLLRFSSTVSVGGLLWFTDGEYGSVSIIPALYDLKPSIIDVQNIKGIEHYIFEFKKGQTVSDMNRVIEDTYVMFGIFTEIILRGKAPLFATPNDVESILVLSKRYAGKEFGLLRTTI